MFKLKRIIKEEKGATSIEAIGLTLVLLSSLLFIILVGSGYWNLTILNTAASSSSLASQTLLNSGCSAVSSVGCDENAEAKAREVNEQIFQDLRSQLIFADQDPSDNEYTISLPNCTTSTIPGTSQALPGNGWGFTKVRAGADFHPLGRDINIPISASAVAVSYQDVC